MTAQPLIALAEAQAARSERAALKRRLAATRPRAAAIGAGLAVLGLAHPARGGDEHPRAAGRALRRRTRPRAEVLDVTRVDPATALAALTRR